MSKRIIVGVHLSTMLKGYQAEMRPYVNPIPNSLEVEHPM